MERTLEDDRSAWKEIAQDWSAAAKLAEQPEKFYEGYSAAVMNAMQALLTKARAELTQRTAELEAANDKVQFLEKKNRNLLDSENLTLKVKADQDVRLASLQAELERVRGELQSAEAGYFVAERELQGANNKYDELHTLIAALPKVEVITSDTVVNIVQQYNFHQWMLRALQHRQGME